MLDVRDLEVVLDSDAGLVRAIRGAGGGYQFSGNARRTTLLDVIEVVRIVKKVNPETIVVVGGPHAHIYGHETASLEGVDFVVTGEGVVQLANPAAERIYVDPDCGLKTRTTEESEAKLRVMVDAVRDVRKELAS